MAVLSQPWKPSASNVCAHVCQVEQTDLFGPAGNKTAHYELHCLCEGNPNNGIHLSPYMGKDLQMEKT